MINNTVHWSPGVKLEDIERQVILAAFRHFRGNKTATANSLGIAIRTLDNKLEKYEADGKTGEKSYADQRARAEEFNKRQRGFTTGPDGEVVPLVERRIYTDKVDDLVVSRKAKQDAERAPNGSSSEQGLHMESASGAPTEQSLPMSVGAQVQSVSPKHAAGNRHGKRR